MGGGAGTAPKPPKFNPVDLGSAQANAIAADIRGYDFSDADFASRFPGLVAGRQESISNAYNQLTGPLDPTVETSFVNKGIGESMNAFGGGDPDAGIGGSGTASRKAVASSVANSVQGKQDYDRSFFDSMLQSNPERTFGLSGGDLSNLSINNTMGLNAMNQGNYAGAVGNANAANASSSQQQQAYIGAALSAAGIAAVLI